jgi:PAT family beta-lactamase induction signal transducer AmpG
MAGHDMSLLVVSVGIENFAAAMGATVFGVLLMGLCDTRFSAFQFALLSALSALPRTLIGPVAAKVVAALGWAPFFVVTCIAAVPGLLVLWLLRRRVQALDILK